MNAITAQDLVALLDQKGDLAYDGEGITQIEHAWQCGQLALQAQESPALQLASWLHDIGHLMTDLSGSPTVNGVDDQHEHLGARVLSDLWGAVVAQPVALHVTAKRYLVTALPGYADKLSPDSIRSLALQGGALPPHEYAAFEAHAFHGDAVKLRAWDDLGKRPHWFALSRQEALDALRTLMEQVSAQGKITSTLHATPSHQ
jgi:predicted HD phosphohydrolase